MNVPTMMCACQGTVKALASPSRPAVFCSKVDVIGKIFIHNWTRLYELPGNRVHFSLPGYVIPFSLTSREKSVINLHSFLSLSRAMVVSEPFACILEGYGTLCTMAGDEIFRLSCIWIFSTYLIFI